MVREDATSSPITHVYGASHVRNFNNILEGSKPITIEGWGSQKPIPRWLLGYVKYKTTRRRRGSTLLHRILFHG
jgi:hypothetical protein